MPAALSLVPAARAALFTTLTTAFTGSGVQVSYSHPGDAMERETVYLGDARGGHELATVRAGRRSRDQTFSIDVWVETTCEGPDAQVASERAWELYGELEDIVANDASLGLTQPFWAAVAEFEETVGWDIERQGAAARLRASVACTGRLQ